MYQPHPQPRAQYQSKPRYHQDRNNGNVHPPRPRQDAASNMRNWTDNNQPMHHNYEPYAANEQRQWRPPSPPYPPPSSFEKPPFGSPQRQSYVNSLYVSPQEGNQRNTQHQPFPYPTHNLPTAPPTYPPTHVFAEYIPGYSIADSNGPINPVNVQITDTEIRHILESYNVTAKPYNYELYRRAFVHESYIRDLHPDYVERPAPLPLSSSSSGYLPGATTPESIGLALKTSSNQGIEFLGDGVLELVAKFYIYKRFQVKDEGFMTDTKIEMVKNETVGRLITKIGLEKWYLVSRHEERLNIRTNMVKLGCLFEAFVGAIFLDFNRMPMTSPEEIQAAHENGIFAEEFAGDLCGPGFQVAQRFIEAVFDKHLDWTTVLVHTENFKRPLQELMQSEFRAIPTFDVVPQETNNATAKATAKSNGPVDQQKGGQPQKGNFVSLARRDEYTMGVYLVIGTDVRPQSNNRTAGPGTQVSGCLGTGAVPITAFTSFRSIHAHLAQHGQVVIHLGSGAHKKKQKAEQFACMHAIETMKSTFSDFKVAVDRTRQKHGTLV